MTPTIKMSFDIGNDMTIDVIHFFVKREKKMIDYLVV